MATSHPIIGALYNSLTAGSKIIGKVITDSDFRVDGIVEGDVTCKGKIVIGDKGAIQGDICCQNADILGCVEGSIKVDNTLSLRATGSINGDVQTKVLVVEPKARFNGSCSMKQEEPVSGEKTASLKEERQKTKEEQKKTEIKTVAEKKREEEKESKVEREKTASLKEEAKAEPKKSLFGFGTKKEEPKKPEPKPMPEPKGEAPVLAVNESSIGNGQDENIITFIDDEPEIVAVEA